MTHHDARDVMKRPEWPEPEHGGQGHGEHDGQGRQMQGMAEMAEQVTRHYDTPVPHSHWPSPDPFPPAVMRGLALGAVAGAIVGAVFGYLLANNILVVPGWELMYSGAPATLYTLWAFLGVALGIATVGVGALLGTPAATSQEQTMGERQAPGPDAESERAVGERAP